MIEPSFGSLCESGAMGLCSTLKLDLCVVALGMNIMVVHILKPHTENSCSLNDESSTVHLTFGKMVSFLNVS